MDADDQRSSQVTSYLIEDGSYFRLRKRSVDLYVTGLRTLASKLGLFFVRRYICKLRT